MEKKKNVTLHFDQSAPWEVIQKIGFDLLGIDNQNCKIETVIKTESHFLTSDIHIDSTDGGKNFDYSVVGCKAEIIAKDFATILIREMSKLKVLANITILDKNYQMLGIDFESPMKLKSLILYPDNVDSVLDKMNLLSLVEGDIDPWKMFKRMIGMAGPPSSGKTEAARALTRKLNIHFGASAEHAIEYARTFIHRYGVPGWELQPFIELGMKRREDDLKAHHIVISDGPRWMSHLYTRLGFTGDVADPQTTYMLHKNYKRSLSATREYTDNVLFVPRGLITDGTRYQTPEDILNLYAAMKSFLDDHNVPYILHDVDRWSVYQLLYKIFKINPLTKNEREELWFTPKPLV